MNTTDRASRSMRDETVLGGGRLEAVHLIVDERLAEARLERRARGGGRSLRDRIGGALVAFGTAVAGRTTGPRGPRPATRTPATAGGPDLVRAGDRH